MPGPRLDPKITAQWARVRGLLRSEVGDASYRSWLKPLTLVSVIDGTAKIAVPTRFMRDWVVSHYGDRLRELWVGENATVDVIDVFVQTPTTRPLNRPAEKPATDQQLNGSTQFAPANGVAETRPEISAPIDPRFTFSNFVVGKPNELAYAAARRVADSEDAAFNPLFLYGGVGLGKTHLMHAIANHTRAKFPERRVVYLSAEKFMFHFIRALRFKDTVAFKEQFRSVDLLMIDDVQFINGKEATQEEFFHTFNDLVDNNRQVVISADKSPSDLEGMEERLRSRLGWGLVADIHATSFELRLGILDVKSERLGVEIPVKVKEFLSHRITSNVRELEGALNRVVAHAELVGREITLETCQEVLHDILRANDRRVTIEEIQKRVSEHFNIRIADMHSARRARAVARPRQVAMYLAKQLTSRSLPEIGRKFGGRDHTTVMHAVKKVEELRQTDSAFCEDVDLLRRMLEG
ncbi:MAG: chromosomal replication initiator protein DnaA [Alphaproteobacteria bacterium]|nr:chromosomal replication initiator protein DnaA [Alphaproteobacteria bacterium]